MLMLCIFGLYSKQYKKHGTYIDIDVNTRNFDGEPILRYLAI
jgi:hypothetical protein